MALLTSEAKMYAAAAVLVCFLGLSGALALSRRQLKSSRAEASSLKAELATNALNLKATQARLYTVNQAMEAYKASAELERQRAKNASENARKAREEFQALAAKLTLQPPPEDAQGALDWAVAKAREIQTEVKP